VSEWDQPACRVCACTEDCACPGGCTWVPDPEMEGDLCSSCLPGVLEHLALGVLVSWADEVLRGGLGQRYVLMPPLVERLARRFGPWRDRDEAALLAAIEEG
jgi:hypothetical protein